ncbi:uncharacterized protein ACNLHF_022240, partial [Anomaloglossus baeobatrachus]
CILDYNSRSDEFKRILERHWSILQLDKTIAGHIHQHPSVTYRKSRNLRDTLVRSHYEIKSQKPIFGAKGPKWGCTTCGKCVACANITNSQTFEDSNHERTYQITHSINCTTKAVIYQATCPCGLAYVGMTSRELRRRIREHVLDIENAKQEEDPNKLKTIPRHFKLKHECDSTLFQAKGIDRILIGMRGGNWKRLLAQRETMWIYKLNTLTPNGLNDHNSFVPFLPI